MMCADREIQLNEFVDGTLGAAARAAVDAHLAECAGCREAVAELRALVAGARGLPRSIEPGRDLWAGVRRRIGQRATGNAQRFWYAALAAAAAAIIVARLSLTAHPPIGPSAGGGWVAVEADYQHSATDLAQTLAVERDRLSPATVAVLERNLAIIDQAIAESREALARDPASVDLRQLVAAAYRQKVELLRWAARSATSS